MVRILQSVGVGQPNRRGDVAIVQALLNQNTLASSPRRLLVQDGIWGPATTAAVMTFQRSINTGRCDYGVVYPYGITFKSLQSDHPSDPNAVLCDYTPTGMRTGGVASSCRNAKADTQRLQSYTRLFEVIGAKYHTPPALIAGIASRESQMGAKLDEYGWGDNHNAFGMLQVDKRSHTIVGTDPDGMDHVDQAVSILHDKCDLVRKKHPGWPAARQLQRAVAIYNGGKSHKTPTLDNIDEGTTGGDYSNDAWAQARYFIDNWQGR